MSNSPYWTAIDSTSPSSFSVIYTPSIIHAAFNYNTAQEFGKSSTRPSNIYVISRALPQCGWARAVRATCRAPPQFLLRYFQLFPSSTLSILLLSETAVYFQEFQTLVTSRSQFQKRDNFAPTNNTACKNCHQQVEKLHNIFSTRLIRAVGDTMRDFHLTKTSDLNFRQLPVANGTAFSNVLGCFLSIQLCFQNFQNLRLNGSHFANLTAFGISGSGKCLYHLPLFPNSYLYSRLRDGNGCAARTMEPECLMPSKQHTKFNIITKKWYTNIPK